MDIDTYYQKTLFVAQVDRRNTILGSVERWKAHKKGILHRGFTTILIYKNKYLLQHRKHPAFDKCWDFTFSSHQLFEQGILQSDVDAIYQSLVREWNLTKGDLTDAPISKGTIYYKAKDPNSIYTEHEFDDIYVATLQRLPKPNSDFSYGFELVSSVEEIQRLSTSYVLCPWVEEILKVTVLPA